MQYITHADLPYQQFYSKALTDFEQLLTNESLFNDTIDEHIRSMCKVVHQSGLGVTLFGCQGHPDVDSYGNGYVMILAKDQASYYVLINRLNYIANDFISGTNWDKPPFVEVDLRPTGDEFEYSYSPVVLRKYFDELAEVKPFWDYFHERFEQFNLIAKGL